MVRLTVRSARSCEGVGLEFVDEGKKSGKEVARPNRPKVANNVVSLVLVRKLAVCTCFMQNVRCLALLMMSAVQHHVLGMLVVPIIV